MRSKPMPKPACFAVPYLPTDGYEPSEAKKVLRKQLRAKRRAMEHEKKAACDALLVAHTLATKEFQSASTIFLYAPLSDEPNLLPLAEAALAQGKQVAFPISHTDTHTLTFHTVDSIDALYEGAYGILEPPCNAPIITDTRGVLCIVPALAFDKQGFRLGYGGGYYDRLLSDFQGVSLGLFYHEFLQNELPRGSLDRAVELLISEKGVRLPDEVQTTK